MFGKSSIPETSDEQQQLNNEENSSDGSDSSDGEVQEVIQSSKSKEDESKSKPLLQEITYVGGRQKGGTRSWVCKHCKARFTSTYTRIHYHFFGCQSGGKPGIKRCPMLMNNRAEYSKIKEKVAAAEEKGVSATLKNSLVNHGKMQLSPNNRIQEAFCIMEREQVDQKVMRFLCANGIAFNVLRSPEFHEMVRAINRAPNSYKGPSYERARTTLLDECKRKVDNELAPVKDTWHTQGVSIISDGWSNVKQQPLINVLAENNRGSMFMYATDFSGVEKTGSAISEFLLKAIDEVGASNIVQVVTDNATNCVAAGREIQKIHPHIFWSPCVVHTVNLIFKDFANTFDWLRSTYKRGKEIVKYITNHQSVLAMFRAQSQLELLKVAKTRFASIYILLRRLLDYREALVTTVCVKSWKDWVKRGDETSRKVGASVAETVKDEAFWEEVENIIKITRPIYLIIRFADGNTSSMMAEIYEKMDIMLGNIKDVMKDNRYSHDLPEMENIILSRWEKMNIPIHCLGLALNQRFYDAHYLQTPAPGGVPRRPPNLDKEVMGGVMEAFHKIVESNAEEAKLREQLATFQMKKGLYATQASQVDAVTMDPIDWWSSYGSETPELAEVAMKVLSQPISSSSAERNWSTYKYIHSVVRNRLNCSRADKLVFIHSNLRLLSRFSQEYKSGPYARWDKDPDNSALEDSTLRLEELKWTDLGDGGHNDEETTRKRKVRKLAKGKEKM